MTMSNLEKMRACRIAWETSDAYSADIWGSIMWTQCAEMLLSMGFTEAEARAVMRSKITRWARDHYSDRITWLGEVATMANKYRKDIEAGEYGDGEVGDHVIAKTEGGK
jgi:hypothetical protein